MTKAEARQHFGTYTEMARVLGLTKGAISLWGDSIPENWQLELHRVTKGVLKADSDILAKYRAILRAA